MMIGMFYDYCRCSGCKNQNHSCNHRCFCFCPCHNVNVPFMRMRCGSGLTLKAEPPPTDDVNREGGTESANGGWPRRLVRQGAFKCEVRQTWRVKYHQLSTEERYELAAMRRQGLRMAKMADHLGRHRSTLYREVKRNQSAHDGRYRATHSVEKAG